MASAATISAAPDRAEAPLPERDWRVVVLRRSGSPPLRFKGRCLARHVGAGRRAGQIGLWEKKTGGYVVELAGDVACFAAPVSSRNAAMDWLEDWCRAAPAMPERGSLVELIEGAGQAIASHRGIRALAGRALADWSKLTLSDTAIQKG